MKIALIPNLTRKTAAAVTKELCLRLDELDIAYSFSEEQRDFFPEFSDNIFEKNTEFIKNSDMVISVGGDGSMLRAAKLAAKENKYIL